MSNRRKATNKYMTSRRLLMVLNLLTLIGLVLWNIFLQVQLTETRMEMVNVQESLGRLFAQTWDIQHPQK